MTKYLTIILGTVLLMGCGEKNDSQITNNAQKPEQTKIQIQKWHLLDRSLDDFSKLQPNRPILIHFIYDWNIISQITQKKYLEEPRFYELLTRYQILPLIADYTQEKGIAYEELNSSDIKNWDSVFLLRLPSGENVWITPENITSDGIYTILQSNLETHLN